MTVGDELDATPRGSLARKRLAESLGPRAGLLADVERDFLPASLEVQLAHHTNAAQARALVALLGAARGVEEVDFLGRWARRLGTLVGLMRSGALRACLHCTIASGFSPRGSSRACDSPS